MDHVLRLTGGPAEVLAELVNEDFLQAFSDEVGVNVSDLTLGESGGQSTAFMRWAFSTAVAGVPKIARNFLPSEVQLTWDQSWGPLGAGDKATGNLKVRLERRPSATVLGSCTLEPTGTGSTLTIRTKTDAELPFPIAGQVENLIDKDLIGWIVEVQARVLERRHSGNAPA